MDKFGVSIISGSRLMRRCRDCWHQQDYRLPDLRKKIVYLDQFVISNLMKLENSATKGHATVAADPFWRELENRIADAPFVKLQSLMFAAIAMRAAQGQKEPPNKGTATDIDTVAHLLPYCDVIFMDNGCRSLLLDVPTALRPSETAKVFPLNVKAPFLDYLRSIRNDISAGHVQVIREAYGDAHL